MVGGQLKTQTLITAFELARRNVRSESTDLKEGIGAGLPTHKAKA